MLKGVTINNEIMAIQVFVNRAIPIKECIVEVETHDGEKIKARFEMVIINNRIIKRFHDMQGSCIEATAYYFKKVKYWRYYS